MTPNIRVIILTLFFVAGPLVLVSNQVWAAQRIALVFGNGTYPNVGNLSNPPNDARLIADTLRQLDFTVIEHIDADQKAMKKAIRSFGQKLSAAGKDAVGLFYYAGHGVQIDGENYLIPVNVSIDSEADVDIESVSLTAIHKQMKYAGNRLNIIIMDACRNNPFKRSFRAVRKGLAEMNASKGTLIAYATAPGDVAADGVGRNSPYTEALSRAMLTAGLTVERVFKKVRNDVVAITNDKQVPWEASSLTGEDFYFKGAPDTPAPVIIGPKADVVFWNSIKNSRNQSDFTAFLETYPDSPFTALARTRKAALFPPWPMAAQATYRGNLTNPVRDTPDKVTTSLTVTGNILSGTYAIFEASGKTTGKLSGFRETGPREGVFTWHDAYGQGTLNIRFSDDYRSFEGRWNPQGNSETGGTWNGQRE